MDSLVQIRGKPRFSRSKILLKTGLRLPIIHFANLHFPYWTHILNRSIIVWWTIIRLSITLVISFLLFSSLFTAPVRAQADSIRFENISTEQGLSQATVNAILQDRRGFMWFATEGGLNQYDGYQFTVYHHDLDNPKSLSDNLVLSLFEDRDGTLWIGTNSGLDRLDRSTGIFVHYPKDVTGSSTLSGVPVSIIGQDPSGALWVGTDGSGLYALDPATNRITEYNHNPQDSRSISNDTIHLIYVDREGEVWIGTDGGLDRFDHKTGTFSNFLPASMSSLMGSNVSVRAIYEDTQGILWIGTKDGLFQWDRTANRFSSYRHDQNDPQSLSDNSISSLYEDSQGNLWIGTLRGLNQFDKNLNRFLQYVHDPNNSYSLSSDYIRSIFEDRSGVLWIGTSYGGLNKYARSTEKFGLYTNHPGLPNNLSDNNIWSVYVDQSANLWIGTFFSGLNKLDPNSGKVTIYQHDPSNSTSLSNNEIRAILQDRSGVLWVGTEHGGLNRFDPSTDTFLHYQHNADDSASLSSDNVFSIYEDHAGRLWIGTENGGLNRFDRASNIFVHYHHDANNPMSLSGDSVRAIFEDHAGNLWIGTEQGGLNLWDDQGNPLKIFRHDAEDQSSLSNDWVSSILEDNNETIWIGTVGGGLDRFDRNTQSFTHYTVKDGLPDDSVYGILADADDNLWLSTNKGLSKFNPVAGTFRNYDISDGLQGDQFNPGAYFQAQNGEMFFGGTKGLTEFHPTLVKDNPIPPPVVITALMKYNQVIPVDLSSNQVIQLSYQDNFISFNFSALDYNAPDKNQYAYQLVGVDKDWVYTGNRRYASYTNLPAGDYTFRVKASNNDDRWNEQGASVRIHITPPFWQTWWFIGIVGLVSATAAMGGYRLRVKDIEARNRELTRRVEQRTHDLATLNAIAEVVSRSLDLKEVMQDALERTMDVIDMTVGSALLLDEATQEMVLIAHRGVSSLSVQPGARWPLVSALAGKSLDGAHPLTWNVEMDYPDGALKSNLMREGVKLVVGVPLIAKGKMVGMLVLNTRTPREITLEESSLLEAIGQQVGIAVENARLYEQAERTAAISERSRLARELHDSVTQLIYSVTLYAEAAAELLGSGETQTAADHLRELRDTAQEALREMRLLIFELRRPALEKSGLAGALQARLDAVESRGGMHAELLVEGTEEIPHPVQEELYNIAQEALNNALKHAHANHVQIRLRFGEAGTELEVSDDGIGFEPTQERLGGGFGIPGMEERAQKLGGTIEVETAPGKGTIIRVQVPVRSLEHRDRNDTNASLEETEE